MIINALISFWFSCLILSVYYYVIYRELKLTQLVKFSILKISWFFGFLVKDVIISNIIVRVGITYFLDLVMDLNRLYKISRMYFFLPFYFIWDHNHLNWHILFYYYQCYFRYFSTFLFPWLESTYIFSTILCV